MPTVNASGGPESTPGVSDSQESASLLSKLALWVYWLALIVIASWILATKGLEAKQAAVLVSASALAGSPAPGAACRPAAHPGLRLAGES